MFPNLEYMFFPSSTVTYCHCLQKYDDIMKERLKDKAANYTCEDNHCMEKMNDLKRRVAAEEAKVFLCDRLCVCVCE